MEEDEIRENVARMRHMKNAYKVLVRNPQRKKQLGRFRRRWEDNIRMNLEEI
jgi:hypothetical protein